MALELSCENYFTPENTAISNSKVNNFLLSKEYYFGRHIAHTIEFERTSSIKIGSIADALVTGGEIPFHVKCLKRDNPDRFDLQKKMD